MKDIKLQVSIDGNNYEYGSTMLLPKLTYDTDSKKEVNYIAIKNNKHPNSIIAISGWVNLKTKISERTVIESNAVLSGSAFFYLDVNYQQLFSSYCQQFSLKIIDFSGKKSTHLLNIKREQPEYVLC